MSKILFAPTILLLCINIYATAKPILIVRAEMPSLATSAGKVCELLEEISPGSSGVIALGVMGLAFKPELRGFDFGEPISLSVYACEFNGKNSVSWSVTVHESANHATPVPKTLKVDTMTLYVKKIDKHYILSPSQQLLMSITKLLPETVFSNQILSATLFTGNYFSAYKENFNALKGSFMTQFYDAKYPVASATERQQAMIKLDALNKILRMVKTVKLDITTNNKGITIAMPFQASADKALRNFIKKQSEHSIQIPPFFAGKGTVIASDLLLTPAFRDVLYQVVTKNIEVLSIDDTSFSENNLKLRNLITHLPGRTSSFLPESRSANTAPAYFRFYCNSAKKHQLENLLNVPTDANRNSFTVTPIGKRRLFYSGKRSGFMLGIAKNMDEYATHLPADSLFSNLQAKYRKASIVILFGEGQQGDISVIFEGESSFSIHVNLTPEAISELIPTRYLPNRRKRIKIEH